MQNKSATFNSKRAAVGRRLGVRAVTAVACERGIHQDWRSAITARSALLPTAERPAPEVWRQTRRHRATRRIGAKSKRSFRISLVDERMQEIRAESLLEARLILALLARPEVVDVIEQPPVVNYRDDGGKLREHWFDCVAVLADGRRLAYVVKPKALAARQGTRRLVELLAMQVEPHVADSVMLVDEDCLSQADSYNAELINSVRLHGPWSDDPVVSAVRAVVRGPMPLDEAVRLAGRRGQGFRAIVRLIADGVLRVTLGEIIDYGSTVEPVACPEILP